MAATPDGREANLAMAEASAAPAVDAWPHGTLAHPATRGPVWRGDFVLGDRRPLDLAMVEAERTGLLARVLVGAGALMVRGGRTLVAPG